MTVSTHVYAAALIGSPDLPLSVRGGSISLDASRAPHVEATLEIAVPDEATLSDLDPRDSRRVRIEVDGEFPSFSQHREFDLALRDRDVQHAAAVVTLTLASDESLLSDYAPLEDDVTPFTLASSLRDVVDYVLGEAIPGAALDASPAVDADVTPYWTVTNLVPNPNVRGIVGNWIAGGSNGTLTRQTGLTGSPVSGVTTYTRTTWSGNSGSGQGGAFGQTGTVAPHITARPFETYTVSAWVRASVPKPVRLSVQVFANDGSVLSSGTDLATTTLVANTWTRLRGSITLPANAARLGIFAYPQTGQQWASGNTFDTLGWLVHEGTLDVPSFDASTTDSHYIYAASGDAHVSASTREPDPIERDPESVIWKAGQSALDFLHPLVQAAGYRIVCDENRTWTLRDENYTAADSLSIRHAVNLIDGSDTISRDAGLWFDARVTRYRWTDRNGIQQERIDAYALSDPYTLLTEMVVEAPYPGPGRSEYAVRRAQGRGREVTATAVADWRTNAEQSSTFVLEGAPTQIGATSRVEFDLDTDRMTVSSRTTDTPEGAIDLLVGTIDALTGTIDSL